MYAVSVHTLRTDGVCGALQVGCHARVADPRACVFAVLVVAVVHVRIRCAGKINVHSTRNTDGVRGDGQTQQKRATAYVN